jgi:hypothetical protein
MKVFDRDGAQVSPGDHAYLVELPESLIHDQPEDEQKEMRGHVGKSVLVERIENERLVWVGFGTTHEVGDDARHSGHSFSIEPRCLRLRI